MFIENIKGGMSSELWEELCVQAYTDKYEKHHFIEVPDRNKGDAGIEGFTQDGKGIAIQCYFPENDYTYRELYEHQRNKINQDINKLLNRKNANNNLKKMGIFPIQEWHFLIPNFSNKDLIKYAEIKSKEVREIIKKDKNFFDYINKDFKIRLCTEKHIAKYLTDYILNKSKAYQINIGFQDEDAIDWSTFSSEIKNNVERKVKKLSDQSSNQRQLIDRFMKAYIANINDMLELKAHSSTIYIKIKNLTDEYTRSIELQSLMGSGNVIPFERYKEINEEFLNKLNSELDKLTGESRDRLSRQMMAKWIGDCPLEF